MGPNSNTSNNNAETIICWNARHAHPLLQVPVCCVCAEDYAAPNVTDEPDHTSRCAGCSAPEDDVDVLLLLCDYPTNDGATKKTTCDRAFCLDCVAKAEGRHAAAGVVQANDPWHCYVCQPTKRIQKLQRSLDDDNDATATLRHPRTIETALDELEAVEEEKKRCEQELDYNVANKAQQFRSNLLSQTAAAAEMVATTSEELEEQVAEAVQIWQDDWHRHHVRLSDRIARLLDELDADFSLSAAMCYNYIQTGKFDQAQVIADEDDNDDDKEPDWVQAANKVVNKRIKERGMQEPWNPLCREMYKLEFYDDVEELGSTGLEDDDVGSKTVRQGWARNIQLEKELIHAAMQSETRELERRSVHVKQVIDEVQDKELEKPMATERRRDYVVPAKIDMEQHSRRSVEQQSVKKIRTKDSALKRPKKKASPWMPTPNSASHSTPGSDKKPSPCKKSLFPSFTPTTTGSINGRSSHIGGPVVLCETSSTTSNSGEKAIRTIAVSSSLSKKLKSHQVEGVQFMFDNCFSDFAFVKEGDPSRVGGCILAHCMGLGKTLSTIAILHTMMTHPSMLLSNGEFLLKKVLLIVPVNTIANWESEFDAWLRDERHQIVVHNFSEVDAKARGKKVQQWSDYGGVLLISERTFQPEIFSLLKTPDVVCLDEAHTMLKNSSTGIYKKLLLVDTSRKIALTGSPFQNNLNEYFQMVTYVRPGILGQESQFDGDYVTPITLGMPSDATDSQVLMSVQKSMELNQRLLPFVHRKDASVLRQELPPLSQAVLTVRPTNMQTRMYRDYKRQKGSNNFFKYYQDLSTVNNHPGSILCTSKTASDGPDRANNLAAEGSKWWEAICEKLGGYETVKGVMNGYKIVLLLHILAYCEKINDKVLIFALNLNALNYIEEVLALEDWKKHVPSLADKFPEMKLGGWRSGQDYLRIGKGPRPCLGHISGHVAHRPCLFLPHCRWNHRWNRTWKAS